MLHSRHWKIAENKIMEFWDGRIANYNSSSRFSSVLKVQVCRACFETHNYSTYFFKSPDISYSSPRSVVYFCLRQFIFLLVLHVGCLLPYIMQRILYYVHYFTASVFHYSMSILRTSNCFLLNFVLSF